MDADHPQPFLHRIIVFDNELGASGSQLQAATIQHSVIFKFPDIEGLVPSEIASAVAAFNEIDGISASFRPHGGPSKKGKTAMLGALEWPDKTEGYTHMLLVLARDAAALRTYLHSDAHLKRWMPAVKPYIQGILVFDTKLNLPGPAPGSTWSDSSLPALILVGGLVALGGVLFAVLR